MKNTSRKTLFEKSIHDVLKVITQGKKSSHDIMKCHLRNTSKDLELINRLPKHLKNINDSHVQALMSYWQHKQLS